MRRKLKCYRQFAKKKLSVLRLVNIVSIGMDVISKKYRCRNIVPCQQAVSQHNLNRNFLVPGHPFCLEIYFLFCNLVLKFRNWFKLSFVAKPVGSLETLSECLASLSLSPLVSASPSMSKDKQQKSEHARCAREPAAAVYSYRNPTSMTTKAKFNPPN